MERYFYELYRFSMNCTGFQPSGLLDNLQKFPLSHLFLGRRSIDFLILYSHALPDSLFCFSFPFFQQNTIYSKVRVTSGKLATSAVSPHPWSNPEDDRVVEGWGLSSSLHRGPQPRDGELGRTDMNRTLGFAQSETQLQGNQNSGKF